ncbi:hypothetical protein (Partial), partial [Seminavis robusta]|eukprot:Sro4743_g354560.1 n/a (217) ;mRNA; r:95-747
MTEVVPGSDEADRAATGLDGSRLSIGETAEAEESAGNDVLELVLGSGSGSSTSGPAASANSTVTDSVARRQLDLDHDTPLETPPLPPLTGGGAAVRDVVSRKESEPMESPPLRIVGNLENMENKFNDGYDSDGEAPPTCTVEDFEEEVIPERLVDGTLQGPEESVTEERSEQIEEPRHVAIPEDDLKKLTVAKIKHELAIRQVQFSAKFYEFQVGTQ